MLKELNENQLEAVQFIDGAMLILAGAGSGKTKTITTRLAYLIQEIGVDPSSILTLTFTNKAAAEMKERALNLLENELHCLPLLCTFHKFGLLFLKNHIGELDRDENFLIVDSNDRKSIIKSFIPAESKLPFQSFYKEISDFKNSLVDYKQVLEKFAKQEEKYFDIARTYRAYENYLLENNLVDFDDLLILPYKILRANSSLAQELSRKYQYIMVDEYQDTSKIQIELLKFLCTEHQNICVVGDDDQSIYSWRGAEIDNILNFSKEFKNVKTVKLEKNYRSSRNILEVANKLISHNKKRVGKNLQSQMRENPEIAILKNPFEDDKKEANYIVNEIKKLLKQGEEAKEIAILYRINTISKNLEVELEKNNIAFSIIGGFRFYERAEIKDLTAYLRLILNPNDNFSFERVINVPRRGIGQASLNKLKEVARQNKLSLYKAIFQADLGRKQNDFLAFAYLIESLGKTENLKELFKKLEKALHLKEYYKNFPDGIDRVFNVDLFMSSIIYDSENDKNFDLSAFLNDLSLVNKNEVPQDAVNLMSIHASKGLEFRHVFVAGFEEGIFPLPNDRADLEEERRLAYVALTRAKVGLTLTHVQNRFLGGQKNNKRKSRFLNEMIGQAFEVGKAANEFKKNQIVNHKVFGLGKILEVEKVKNDYKLTINFGSTKRVIMASYVEKVSY